MSGIFGFPDHPDFYWYRPDVYPYFGTPAGARSDHSPEFFIFGTDDFEDLYQGVFGAAQEDVSSGGVQIVVTFSAHFLPWYLYEYYNLYEAWYVEKFIQMQRTGK
ncbi:MAG: hypothetical protein IT271_04410 [Chitinophagales bacterium]|nr:hypothetical protein [Chitinophagales bacterium]